MVFGKPTAKIAQTSEVQKVKDSFRFSTSEAFSLYPLEVFYGFVGLCQGRVSCEISRMPYAAGKNVTFHLRPFQTVEKTLETVGNALGDGVVVFGGG